MPPRSSFRRLIPRLAAAIVFILIIALLIAKPIATAYVRDKLQETLGKRLDAELSLGPLSYSFPLGVHVGESKIITKDPAGGEFEILGMSSFDLVLHQLPFRPGPLIIEQIAIGHPTLHIIRTGQGYVGVNVAVHHPAADPERPERKLSEIFQLRHVKLEDGEVHYEDRGSGAVPLVWKGLNIDLGTEPSSGAKYAFDLSAIAGKLAKLSASGEFDIDNLDLNLTKSTLAVQSDPNAGESPVPSFIQDQLKRYNVKGDLVIETSASMALRNIKAASFDTKITLKGASAELPDQGLKLNDVAFSLECRRSGDSPILAFVFSTAIRAAGATVSIERGTAKIDTDKRTFVLDQFDTIVDLGSGKHEGLPETIAQTADTLKPGGKVVVTFAASGPFAKPSFDTLSYEFAAYARDISIKPPGFPQYLTAVNISAKSKAGIVTFENCSANYGADTLHVFSARLPVEYFNRFIHFNEINAGVVMRDPHPPYPDVLENIFAMINPRGTIAVAGDVSVDLTTDDAKVDYDLQISTDHAQFSPTKYKILMTDAKCDLTVAPQKIALKDLEAELFDGRLRASGQMLGKSPMTYQAQVAVRAAQLKNVIETFNPDRLKSAKPITGRWFLNTDISGSSDPPTVDPLATMKGRGELEVVNGDFWDLPVLRTVVNQSSVAGQALTVGHAGAVYNIANQKVTFKNMAVSAPVLGIQGSGTVGFDGALDLKLVAAPLADWRRQVKSTGIPILSDVAGEVFGVAQKAINSATKKILYEFHVTGVVGNPKITTIPAPALTKSAARLFMAMVRAGENLDLMGTVRADDSDSGTEQK